MSLLLSDFKIVRDMNFKTPVKEIHNYIKQLDPYFDMRRVQTFFGNKTYRQDGYYIGIGIPDNAEECIAAARTRYDVDPHMLSAAVAEQLMFPVPGHTARASQVNAVAKARGLTGLHFNSDIPDHGINWRGVLYAGVIKRGLLWYGPGINKPLSVYDLTWWVNEWSTEQVSEEEVIAAMDAPMVRVKLNWDMGTGYAWKDVRLLHAGDLGWYTGPFPDLLARNDGKAPPPPDQPYGYGYVSLDDARTARDKVAKGDSDNAHSTD